MQHLLKKTQRLKWTIITRGMEENNIGEIVFRENNQADINVLPSGPLLLFKVAVSPEGNVSSSDIVHQFEKRIERFVQPDEYSMMIDVTTEEP